MRAQILDTWGFEPASTEIVLITVSENATFLVKTAGQAIAVVRVSRPGYVDNPQQISSELAWVRALGAEIDVPVPAVIAARDGSDAQVLRDEDGFGWFAVAFAFVDGEILEDDFSNPLPYYERIGHITAKFHQHSRSWSPSEDFIRHSWTLADMVGENARWGDWRNARLSADELALFEEAESAALAVAESLPRGSSDWGVIHADLRPSNIMLNDEVLTVIDFDDCGYSWYLYDFASAFSFIEHLPVTPALAQAWMRGYESAHRLSSDAKRGACALSMIRRLQMLGWTTTHREDALPADLWNAQIPGTVEVARNYLRQPLWMLESSL